MNVKCVPKNSKKRFLLGPVRWLDFARVPQTMSMFGASLSRHMKLRDHLNLASSYTSLTCKLALFCSSETASMQNFIIT